MISTNFKSFFSERCKEVWLQRDPETWGITWWWVPHVSLLLPIYPRQGTAETCNRHRPKELLEELALPKPRDRKTCSLTLEIFLAIPSLLQPNNQGKKSHLAPLQFQPWSGKLIFYPSPWPRQKQAALRSLHHCLMSEGLSREMIIQPLPDEEGNAPISPPGYWSPLGAEHPPLLNIKETDSEMPVGANKCSTLTPPLASARLSEDLRPHIHLASRR